MWIKKEPDVVNIKPFCFVVYLWCYFALVILMAIFALFFTILSHCKVCASAMQSQRLHLLLSTVTADFAWHWLWCCLALAVLETILDLTFRVKLLEPKGGKDENKGC